jgi:hypothetical protein
MARGNEVNRFCCDHLCNQGHNCPLDFKDTVPDNDWLRRWMAENSSPCHPTISTGPCTYPLCDYDFCDCTGFVDTEPAPPPSSGGLWVVLTALFVVAIFVLLGVWHAYR